MALGEIIEPVIPSKWRLAEGDTVAIKIPLVTFTANSEAKREFCDLSSSLNGIPVVVTCDFVIRAPESGGGKRKWLAGHLKQCRENPAIRLRWLESLWRDAMAKVRGLGCKVQCFGRVVSKAERMRSGFSGKRTTSVRQQFLCQSLQK